VIVLTNRSNSHPAFILDKIAAHYGGLRDRILKTDQSVYEAELTLEAGINTFCDVLTLKVPQRAPYVFRVDVRDPRSPLLTVGLKPPLNWVRYDSGAPASSSNREATPARPRPGRRVLARRTDWWLSYV
jgi:hypothetical protein